METAPGSALEVEVEAAFLTLEGAGHRQILASWALHAPSIR